MIHKERVQDLNKKDVKKGRYVVYWMQASQRCEYNHALEYAILRANELHIPVVVYFGITDNVPGAQERHYRFMLEGLQAVESALTRRGIPMIVQYTSPETGVVELARHASLVVVDRGYLKREREWRTYAAGQCVCPVIQVESNVVVPVEAASPKEEYSAATLRPKIEKNLEYYLVPVKEYTPHVGSPGIEVDTFDISNLEKALSSLNIKRTVKKAAFKGGTEEAKAHLTTFINRKLSSYAEFRNDPTKEYLSNMSPYLHFGQISPLYIASKVLETGNPGSTPYLEELIVRRELSMNFVYYNNKYDSLEGLPAWCRKTLGKHRHDMREYTYTVEELEHAQTHDPYWNACQKEMVSTGKMHGYMRMYWGKKIIEWSETPEDAYTTCVYLNDKYELDGRDPNGYTGVAWCFGKHDRPWKERPIFGNIRYMNDKGLKRKFDADLYVERIEKYSDHE